MCKVNTKIYDTEKKERRYDERDVRAVLYEAFAGT